MLSILTDLNRFEVWTVSILSWISSSPKHFSRLFEILPRVHLLLLLFFSLFWEFFKPALAEGFSLEFVRLQVSRTLLIIYHLTLFIQFKLQSSSWLLYSLYISTTVLSDIHLCDLDYRPHLGCYIFLNTNRSYWKWWIVFSWTNNGMYLSRFLNWEIIIYVIWTIVLILVVICTQWGQ